MVRDYEPYIQRGLKKARQSPAHVKVACILIDRRGHIVAIGYNHFGNGRGLMGRHMIHAERDALDRVRKPSPELTMVLVRRHRKLITPCDSCMKLINAYQIKTIIHTAGKL